MMKLKNLKHGLMGLVMTVLMIVCLVAIPQTAYGSDPEGFVTFVSGDDFFTAAKNGTLTSDVTVTGGLVINESATLDLGGHTITLSGSPIVIQSGSVCVTNGEIIAHGDAFRVEAESGSAALTINDDVTITATECCVYIKKPGSVLNTMGTLTSTGNYAAIQGNGSDGNGGITVNINGGSITSNCEAVYFPNTTDLNIEDGTLTGTTAVFHKSGTLTISGGTLIGNGTKVKYVHNANGCDATGDALVIEACDYPGGVPVVSIVGGTFISENADAIGYYKQSKTYKLANEKFIKAGTFSTSPAKYVSPDYEIVEKDGMFTTNKLTPKLEGLFLRTVTKDSLPDGRESGIYVNVINLPCDVESSIKIQLFAGDVMLQEKTLTRTASSAGKLGGTFYTVGTSSSWTETEWTAKDNVVPTHVVAYVNGQFVDEKSVAFTAEEWAAFDGTVATPELTGGHINNGLTDGEEGITFQAENMVKGTTVRVELFANDRLLTYKEIVSPVDGRLTCTFYTKGTSSSWTQDNWQAYDDVVPTKAVLYVDGTKVAEDNTIEFTANEWAALDGTLARDLTGGHINTGLTDGEEGITFQAENVAKGETVRVELFAGDKLLTYKQIVSPVTGRLTCTFYTMGTSSSWTQDVWKAYDSVVPTKAVLYINGTKVAEDTTIEFTAEEWADLNGTAGPEITGGILVDRMATDNEAGICFELLNVPKNANVLVKLYADDKELGTKAITFAAGGTLTCNFYTVGTSSSWTQTPAQWDAYDCLMPTHAVLYINDEEVGSCDVNFNSLEWTLFAGTKEHEAELRGEVSTDSCDKIGYTGSVFCTICEQKILSGQNIVIPCDPEDEIVKNKKEASCSEEGYTGDVYCSVCDKEKSKGTVIDKLDHEQKTATLVGVKSAECGKPGYTGDWVCKCGETITKGTEIPALEHDKENAKLVGNKDAECGVSGYTGDLVCPLCDDVLEKGDEIKALEHKTSVVGYKDATCKEKGYTGDEVCELCEEIIKQGTEIAVVGHKYENGQCTVCGTEQTGTGTGAGDSMQDSTDAPTDDETDAPSDEDVDNDSPVTGDSNMSWVYIVIMVLAIATIGGILLIKKGQKKDE